MSSADGPFFVKAMKNRAGGRRDSLLRERAVAPYVEDVSPPLRWSAESESWLVLGFDAVDARPADFTPRSPDLDAVVDLVRRIGELPLPEVAADWHERRWHRFAASGREAHGFEGDALLYTDINPSNFLIGERSWVVDWSWPTRGAAFIDPARLVLQLVAAGHTPEAAEAHAARCPAWTDADPAAVDAFAAAELRMHTAFAGRNPDAVWLREMTAAAEQWVRHGHSR
ncbi:protein kinase [Streptomyces sp. NPDC051567]|uniref:protein kinase n=1 Tax=Streptomyces sp. NPDC051567 TaxID=3365660 RepID=UPI0037A4BCFA